MSQLNVITQLLLIRIMLFSI